MQRAEAALRENEAHYERFVHDAPIGIYRTTPDGRFLRCWSRTATG
jgi:PAS domain-containing protein